ncbi:MAG: OsmC family protein [Lentimicrobiaceae bacterium]|nr:OsmC family protein [Lentimicrobiaceae bacterium]
MKQTIETKWQGKMKFLSKVNNHEIMMDAAVASGGEDSGVLPKPLMVTALAGCTGMDVVSILNKMKVQFDEFDVVIEAEMTEEHPKHYTAMHIIYKLKGNNIDKEKVEKAVNLSLEKYCGVNHVYKQVMNITHEIVIGDW